MKRRHKLGFLLIAIGALAMLAVPSIAAAKQRDRNHDGIPTAGRSAITSRRK
jgi:hypothetical protein